jgi:hypothetical protein
LRIGSAIGIMAAERLQSVEKVEIPVLGAMPTLAVGM